MDLSIIIDDICSHTDLNKMNILLKTFNENLSNRLLNDEDDKKKQNTKSKLQMSTFKRNRSSRQ